MRNKAVFQRHQNISTKICLQARNQSDSMCSGRKVSQLFVQHRLCAAQNFAKDQMQYFSTVKLKEVCLPLTPFFIKQGLDTI